MIKRVMVFGTVLMMALVGSGCGSKVDESLLPTPIATFDFSTQASNSQAATAAPVQAAATETPSSSSQNKPTATEPATNPVTEAATVEPTRPATAASEVVTVAPITPTAITTTSNAITATAAVTAAVAPVSTELAVSTTSEITTTPVLTNTAALTSAAVVTTAPALTTTSELTTATTVSASVPLTASAAVTATEAVSATGELTATTAADPILAGVPAGVVAAFANADPARGQTLTMSSACIGCHNVDPTIKMTGPTWHNIANTAATRVPGESAGLYLYTSITNPNQYVVEGYQPGLMIPTYRDMLSDQDIADIMAYLLTLKGE